MLYNRDAENKAKFEERQSIFIDQKAMLALDCASNNPMKNLEKMCSDIFDIMPDEYSKSGNTKLMVDYIDEIHDTIPLMIRLREFLYTTKLT